MTYTEPTQVFFYSPVKYVGQALGRMIEGLKERRLGAEHLPLPPAGVNDPAVLVAWRNSIHRPGKREFARWVKKAKDSGFWDDVLYIQPGKA